MVIWFLLLGVGIILVFKFIEKALDRWNEQERERESDIRDRWYEERDKVMEEVERHIKEE